MTERDRATKKAVVIGAGIIGVATGLYLQRDGWKVTLVDPKGLGEGTSKGNAGMFAIGHVVPIAMPDLLTTIPRMLFNSDSPISVRWNYLPRLIPWLVEFIKASNSEHIEASGFALAGLMNNAMASYETLFQSAGASNLIRNEGVLYVYRTPKSFAAAELEIKIKRDHGVRMELLESNEIREFAPTMAPIHSRGIFYPDYAHTVDPYLLTKTLGKRLVQAGAKVDRTIATGFLFDGDRVSTVVTSDHNYKADIIVLAAGAHSGPLAIKLKTPVPLEAERGYHVTFGNSGVDLKIPVLAVDEHFLITPMEPGLRSAGLVEFGGLEAPPNRALHSMLVRETKHLFPGINTSHLSNWMGYRPAMPDSLPIIGRTPKFDNAFLAFGHGHIGLTSAAATGQAISDLAANRSTQFNVHPFRPNRF